MLFRSFPHLEILGLQEMLDDRDRALEAADKLLTEHGDIAGIYNIGAGNQGIAKALKQRGMDHSTIFIGHDATETNNALLLDGTLDAVVDQYSLVQAREAMNVLQHAIDGLPYTPHLPRVQMIFRENIPVM